jgi:predicted double-glycine peptidase
VICLVNGAVLDGTDSYRPHFVMVREIDGDDVTLDDPGPPPHPVLHVTAEQFLRAWTDPSPSVTNYIACKRK